jgi:hypothetical protein
LLRGINGEALRGNQRLLANKSFGSQFVEPAAGGRLPRLLHTLRAAGAVQAVLAPAVGSLAALSSIGSGVQRGLFAKAAGRGLTLRSSRPAPARHPGRPVRLTMLHRSAGVPCLHGRLSSNVSPRVNNSARHGRSVVRSAERDARVCTARLEPAANCQSALPCSSLPVSAPPLVRAVRPAATSGSSALLGRLQFVRFGRNRLALRSGASAPALRRAVRPSAASERSCLLAPASARSASVSRLASRKSAAPRALWGSCSSHRLRIVFGHARLRAEFGVATLSFVMRIPLAFSQSPGANPSVKRTCLRQAAYLQR